MIDWKKPDYEAVFKERIDRLTRLRAEPSLIPSVKAFYADNPVQFITDFGMTFDPRNAEIGLPTMVPFILFPRQAEFVEWVVERWKGREDGLAEKSRDMGVSWLCCAIAVWMWLFKPGTVVGFGSRKEEYVDKLGDPKSLFWKIRQFIDLLPAELKPKGYVEKIHAPHMRILNPENGAVIAGEAGDNIGRGNRTSIYFKDESAFYERPEAIDAALSQTSNCKIDVSTPNGAGNPFYRKAHSGKVKKFVFDWRDDPRKDEAWYRKQCDSLDAVVVAQEIDRNYEASVANAFIPGDIVKAAMERSYKDTAMVGPILFGVDVARFGDDKTCICVRQGRGVIDIITMEGQSVTQVAARVRAEVEAFKTAGNSIGQIAVDTIGIGAGVADILRDWFGDIVQDINASERMGNGQDYNLRAFMWRQMREWLKAGTLPTDFDLKAELTSLRYGFRGGELLLESKDDAKRRGVHSPDRADALALTFAKPVNDSYKAPTIHIPVLDSTIGY